MIDKEGKKEKKVINWVKEKIFHKLSVIMKMVHNLFCNVGTHLCE